MEAIVYSHKAYFIESLSNTHVGSGDSNLGVVDNVIQKDPVTNIPVFHSSSLKGAIREHIDQYEEKDKKSADFIEIFGSSESKPGNIKFYEARLLTLPLRCCSEMVYYHASSKTVLIDYLDNLSLFAVCNNNIDLNMIEKLKQELNKLSFDDDDKEKEFIIFNQQDASSVQIEDYTERKDCSALLTNLRSFGFEKYIQPLDQIAVFRDDIFSNICQHSLPIIARNQIKTNGTSGNLWYEEVLPRKSKLWAILGFPNGHNQRPFWREFEKHLQNDLIQMGANASLGYGVTRIKEIGA